MSNSKKLQLSDEVYLQHILTEVTRIREVMQGKTATDLERDWELEHKVTRSLEIMGEASSRIGVATKQRFPDIPWQEMKGLRNRVIHQYFEINYQLIHVIVHSKLSELKEQLEKIIKHLHEDQSKRFQLTRKDQPLLIKKKRSSKRRGLGR